MSFSLPNCFVLTLNFRVSTEFAWIPNLACCVCAKSRLTKQGNIEMGHEIEGFSTLFSFFYWHLSEFQNPTAAVWAKVYSLHEFTVEILPKHQAVVSTKRLNNRISNANTLCFFIPCLSPCSWQIHKMRCLSPINLLQIVCVKRGWSVPSLTPTRIAKCFVRHIGPAMASGVVAHLGMAVFFFQVRIG